MRVWCTTDRESPELRLSGLMGVSVTVGGTTLKPGDSMDVPSHLIPEVQSALRNKLLSKTKPPGVEAIGSTLPAPPPAPTPVAPAVVEPVSLDLKTVEVSVEVPESESTEYRRRRR